MKTLLYILVTVSVLVTIVACTRAPEPIITEVVVLKDITEAQSTNSDAQGIFSLFDFSGDNKWNGGVFHYSDLSDVSYNRFSEVKINPAGMWLSNEFEREKEIKNFRTEVSKILEEGGKSSKGKSNSSVYLPITHELNEVGKSKANRRVVLIYSDLMENTADISFYSKKQFLLLTKNPDSIQKKFEQMQVLQNLNGVEVNFIYQPIDSKSDKVFTIVSTFFKQLLEAKGAKVNISANINL
ncbi:MAG: hypothetical protein WAV23_02895 [Minisyncoccia bacterium]